MIIYGICCVRKKYSLIYMFRMYKSRIEVNDICLGYFRIILANMVAVNMFSLNFHAIDSYCSLPASKIALY